MRIELLNGFTRVNPTDTQNVYSLQGDNRKLARRKRRERRRENRQARTAPTQMIMARQAQRETPGTTAIRKQRQARRQQPRDSMAMNRRLTQQQMLMGYDVNYFLKDNALYDDTNLMPVDTALNLPVGLVAGALKKRRKKKKGIPRAEGQASESGEVEQTGRERRQARRAKRKSDRRARKIERREDRQGDRRTRRTDRQEARRKRQEQRQAMRLARAQARQDRKLAQTQARQEDNIIKAQARAGATESGQTFGARAGEFLSNVGETAGQLLADNPNVRIGVQEFIEDSTGLRAGALLPGDDFTDDFTADDDFQEKSFFEKYGILLLGAGAVGVYLLTKKK